MEKTLEQEIADLVESTKVAIERMDPDLADAARASLAMGNIEGVNAALVAQAERLSKEE